MTLTYADARMKLGNRSKRKLERNTYLEPVDADTVAVRLHSTNLILIHSDGRYTLNTGGWRTVTTKARINAYSPARLYSASNIWYVGDVVYADGIVVNGAGVVLSGGRGVKKEESSKRRLDKMVREYIKGYAASVAAARKLEAPSGGDCWLCLMGDRDTSDPSDPHRGLEPAGLDHLFGHMEEGYYVPALLFKACKAVGYGKPDYAYSMMMGNAERGDTRMLERTLTGYFRRLKPAMLDHLRGREPEPRKRAAA